MEAADELVQQMLEDDVIEPSDSPWATPAVLVTKKDVSIRFCVDYRKVIFLLRKILTHSHTLGAEYFCTMDLARGYWQMRMK